MVKDTTVLSAQVTPPRSYC